MNPVFQFLDRKIYKLDGVAGFFRHEVTQAIYPYKHTVERLVHVASARGKQSQVYRDMRAQLHDDYVTDLTNSIERYCAIAVKLGFDADGPDMADLEAKLLPEDGIQTAERKAGC